MTAQLAQKTGIPEGVAYSVLIKCSWDITKALEELKDANYLQKTFSYDIKAGKVRAALALQD